MCEAQRGHGQMNFVKWLPAVYVEPCSKYGQNITAPTAQH